MGAKEEVQEGLSSLAAKVFSLRENFRVGALILARSFPFPQPSVFCWGNTRGGGVFLCLLDPALWMRSGHGDWGVGGPRCEVGTGVVAQGEETPSLGCSSLGGGWAPWVVGRSSTLAPDSCPDLGPKKKGQRCQATAKETEKPPRVEGE